MSADRRVVDLNADANLWPCDRRDAHGPHDAIWRQRAHEGTPFATTETGEYRCPGVPAHPATQIGRIS